MAEARRVALLARPGEACERLRAALREAGGAIVLEADPSTLAADALAASAPEVVLVALDPQVEDALERFDAVLGDPAIDVIYDEAELAARREGWDAARWIRHLAAKLHSHDDVLPPGREPEQQQDLHPVPGRPTTPEERHADVAFSPFADEALEFIGGVPADTLAEPLATMAVPEASVPDLSTPELSMPDLSMPDLSMPDFSMPDFSMPDPSMPDFSMPELSVPELSTSDWSDLGTPELSMPEPSTSGLSELAMPELSMPELSIPELSIPDVSAHRTPEPETAPVNLGGLQFTDDINDMTFDDAPPPSVPEQPVADAPAPAAPRFQHDLADLERRIASMELVDVAPPVAATDTTKEAHDPGADARGAVLILAGIGGPDAVRQVLAGLPEGFPRPLLISQRLDGGRYDRLVQQMARATSLPVLLAESGTVATPGQVYIVPPELGITPADRGLRFVADAGLLQALPAEDSAVLLLSGSDPAEVDAALAQAAQGALVAGQAPDGCYDGAASNALVARGGVAAAPAELVQQLLQRWAPSLAS